MMMMIECLHQIYNSVDGLYDGIVFGHPVVVYVCNKIEIIFSSMFNAQSTFIKIEKFKWENR